MQKNSALASAKGITYQSHYVQAKAASDFLDDRKAADMPVPTDDQVKRAERMVQQNYALRQAHGTPLGILLLALKLPTTRHDRRAARAAALRDKTEAPVELKPIRVADRQEALEASDEAVKAFVEANPHMDAVEAAEGISASQGYRSGPPLRRLTRWLRSGRPISAMPGHIREKAIIVSAIAKAGEAIALRDKEAAGA